MPGDERGELLQRSRALQAYRCVKEDAMLEPIRSDAIAVVEYDAARRTLTVMFRRGGQVYRYFHVPLWLYQRLLVGQPHPWRRWGKTIMAHPGIRLP